MTCANCKHFKIDLDYLVDSNFGTCESNKIVRSVKYTETSKLYFTGLLPAVVGKDFGCVHFEKLNNSNDPY